MGVRVGIVGAVILAGLLVAAIVLRRSEPRRTEPSYRTEIVTSKTIVGVLKIRAWIEPTSTVHIGSTLPGQVTQVRVSVGDRVKRGQVLARLDDVEQRASLADADALVTMAELRSTRAQGHLRDALRLLKDGGSFLDEPPIEELLEGPAGEAQIDLLNAAAQIQRQDAALASAQQVMDRRVIRAPVSGVILARSVERGETIASSPPGPPLFVIASNPQHLKIRADVDETYVAQVRPGQAHFTVKALPGRAFTAVVQQVAPNPRPNRSPVRYDVVLAVDNPDGALLAGMSVTVDLPMSSPNGSPRLPLGAVDFSSAATTGRSPGAETATVWVVNQARRPTPVSVDIGVTDGRFIEIRSPSIAPGHVIAVVSNPP